MKRSVAIYGPTPEFVRWTIKHDCDLREIDVKNLPDHTFRQLRGVREFSIGLTENRVFEDICVHPSASVKEVDSCRGFKAHEVLDAHGTAESIGECCNSCPANALAESQPRIWAGCFGWLAANGNFSFETSMREPIDVASQEPVATNAKYPTPVESRFDFVQLLNLAIENLELESAIAKQFKPTRPRWYGIWKQAVLSKPHLELLLPVFEKMISDFESAASGSAIPTIVKSSSLNQFRDALRSCLENNLVMHVELMPPGVSDGTTWTISSHCPDCTWPMDKNAGRQKCLACGRFGFPSEIRKSKVLGLRPYVHLSGILGEVKTKEFMNRYDSSR